MQWILEYPCSYVHISKGLQLSQVILVGNFTNTRAEILCMGRMCNCMLVPNTYNRDNGSCQNRRCNHCNCESRGSWVRLKPSQLLHLCLRYTAITGILPTLGIARQPLQLQLSSWNYYGCKCHATHTPGGVGHQGHRPPSAEIFLKFWSMRIYREIYCIYRKFY